MRYNNEGGMRNKHLTSDSVTSSIGLKTSKASKVGGKREAPLQASRACAQLLPADAISAHSTSTSTDRVHRCTEVSSQPSQRLSRADDLFAISSHNLTIVPPSAALPLFRHRHHRHHCYLHWRYSVSTMPKKEEFVLKDSPPELIKAAGVEPKGREYDAECAKKPGAVRIDEVLLGTKLACVAITDDEEGTLEKISKMNPWHTEALKMITGSEEEAHKPLTHILEKHFNLKCDKILNLTGWSGGRPIDTQGYIAHNDDTVVVAFRCTTSALDWMTNLATTSSEWEIEEDVAQGHSGMLSCFEGRCFVKGPKKPRVHTGFYNNILKCIPFFREFVDPLLAADQSPKKLYVVGHSLGAGISTMATCYFLQHHDWKNLPHKFINISAGTPRSCKPSMAEIIEKKLDELRPLDKAVVCRVVMNEDVVTKVPPLAIGYTHIGKLVLLTEDGYVLVGPKRSDSHIIDDDEMQELAKNNPQLIALAESKDKEEEEDVTKSKLKTEYENMMAKIPRPLRDHCPDFYLAPLIKLYERDNEAELATQ